jgi:hypothetical protein
MSTKPGRNDPCYCGSGKKYKRCHLPIDEKARSALAPPSTEEAVELREDLDEAAPEWGGGPRAAGDLGAIFKLLSRPGRSKDLRELRRLFKGKDTLLTYLGHKEEIEAAAAKLEPYEEQFQKLLDNDRNFTRRCQKLFAEESFAPLRFTAADLQRAFEKVGFPPNLEDSEKVQKTLLSALRFLASEEHRDHLAMELLMRMPKYVEAGHFIDARLIEFVAGALADEHQEGNPFLVQMLFHGVRAWAAQQEASREAVMRELGLRRDNNMGPDEIDAWVAQHTADPVKAARLERLLNAHPGLRGQSNATIDTIHGHTAELFKRQDAACLFLRSEEIEPWLPVLTEKLKVMAETYGPPEGGAPLSEAQQKETFSTVLLPALREMAKGIFTPERIRKLVADLRAYRKELFAAGESDAAVYATAAINYVEPENDPSQNVFLINLCARSLFGLGSGPKEEF